MSNTEAKCPVCGEDLFFRKAVPDGWLRDAMGDMFTLPRACACKRRENAERDAERERKQREIETKRREIESFASISYRGMTFGANDGMDENSFASLRKYASHMTDMLNGGYGILMTGDPGGGKTFAAACIANYAFDNGYSVLMTDVPTLAHELMTDYGEHRDEVLAKIRNRQFLVLDDLGYERDTSTMKEKVFEIINARYESGKPLIVTTNLTMEQLKSDEIRNSRIFSRIREMCPLVLNMGVVRRNAIGRRKFAEMWEAMNR